MFQKALKISPKKMKLYSVKRGVKKMEAANIKKTEPKAEQSVSENESQALNVPEGLNIVIDLDKNNFIQGLIMSEILGRPKAIRSRGIYTWSSRF
jgi:hypothetical protein